MKKLLISILTITWMLYSAALCTADDFCPASIQWNSGAFSIKPVKNEVASNCINSDAKSVLPDSSKKQGYKYGSTDYISEQVIPIEQEDHDY